ncbi:hypothetical protein BB558_004693 [Smittium angustum]|uniref:Uncharacterized protein n=1 Tax=Smittium angustum TaxID=133377 RepID=A0A2U1J2K8_SMIAN|nr:hypothetical protein BB558_004693 [Smittium angustum]
MSTTSTKNIKTQNPNPEASLASMPDLAKTQSLEQSIQDSLQKLSSPKINELESESKAQSKIKNASINDQKQPKEAEAKEVETKEVEEDIKEEKETQPHENALNYEIDESLVVDESEYAEQKALLDNQEKIEIAQPENIEASTTEEAHEESNKKPKISNDADNEVQKSSKSESESSDKKSTSEKKSEKHHLMDFSNFMISEKFIAQTKEIITSSFSDFKLDLSLNKHEKKPATEQEKSKSHNSLTRSATTTNTKKKASIRSFINEIFATNTTKKHPSSKKKNKQISSTSSNLSSQNPDKFEPNRNSLNNFDFKFEKFTFDYTPNSAEKNSSSYLSV